MEDEKAKRSSGVLCAAKGCYQKKLKKEKGGISFHHFPLKEPARCQRWIEESKIKREPDDNDILCGAHFKDSDYKSEKRCFLKDDAIPSVFE